MTSADISSSARLMNGFAGGLLSGQDRKLFHENAGFF